MEEQQVVPEEPQQEERQEGVVQAIVGKAVRILRSPTAFFQEMPRTGGYAEPLTFMVAMGLTAGILQALVLTAFLRLNVAMAVLSIVITPVMSAIFGFVGSGVLFVIWKLMGSQESYETAYRCTAAIAALSPFITLIGPIPYLGAVVGIGAYMFFLIIASVQVHNISSQKAWIVFCILGVFLMLVSINSQSAKSQGAAEFAERMAAMEKSTQEMQAAAERMSKMQAPQ